MLKGKGLLTSIQRRCLSLFARLPDQDRFYLTGGTALAEYHLGHRISLDLDLFTTEEGLILPFAQSLERGFTKQGWGVRVTKRFATYAEFDLSSGAERHGNRSRASWNWPRRRTQGSTATRSLWG